MMGNINITSWKKKSILLLLLTFSINTTIATKNIGNINNIKRLRIFMKTYILIWFSAEGENPMLVVQRLTGLGFKPVIGYYDMEYDHGREVDFDEIMSLSIKVHETLKGSGVLYKLETASIEKNEVYS